MTLLGHGIDVVPIPRIARMLDDHADRFLERCFTEHERSYCEASAKRSVEHLAARFAAKEAVLKALGTGWRSGIAWTDVEIGNEPSGRPFLTLHGGAKRIADEIGIMSWSLSMSHTEEWAVASAIAMGE